MVGSLPDENFIMGDFLPKISVRKFAKIARF